MGGNKIGKIWQKDRYKNKKQNVENSSPLYQTYTPTAVYKHTSKLYNHTVGKWFIHGPKHRKDNRSVSKPETLTNVCFLGRGYGVVQM